MYCALGRVIMSDGLWKGTFGGEGIMKSELGRASCWTVGPRTSTYVLWNVDWEERDAGKEVVLGQVHRYV